MLTDLCEMVPLRKFEVSLTGYLELHLSGVVISAFVPEGNMAVSLSTAVPEGALGRTFTILLPIHLLLTLCSSW